MHSFYSARVDKKGDYVYSIHCESGKQCCPERVITSNLDRDLCRNGINLVAFDHYFFSKNPDWLVQDRFIAYNSPTSGKRQDRIWKNYSPSFREQ